MADFVKLIIISNAICKSFVSFSKLYLDIIYEFRIENNYNIRLHPVIHQTPEQSEKNLHSADTKFLLKLALVYYSYLAMYCYTSTTYIDIIQGTNQLLNRTICHVTCINNLCILYSLYLISGANFNVHL